MLHVEDFFQLTLIKVSRDTLDVEIDDFTLLRARLDLLIDTDSIVLDQLRRQKLLFFSGRRFVDPRDIRAFLHVIIVLRLFGSTLGETMLI